MLVLSSGAADGQESDGLASTVLRALVVDRQPLFQAALGNLLAAPPIGAQVTLLSSTENVIELVVAQSVALVVCEARARPLTGADVAAQLAVEGVRSKVLLLADRDDGALLLASLRSGAAGFFFKDSPVEEFLDGIRSVLAGHTVLCRTLTQQVIAQLEEHPVPTATPTPGHLSPTELAILIMLGRAQSIRSIAASKGVSQKTVRNHLANIYRKLDVRGRTDAVLFAARTGLVDIQG